MKATEKVAQKSSGTSRRATVTLGRDIYRKIDALRGKKSRAAWLTEIIEEEQRRREREKFASLLRDQYSEAVCRETLKVNEDFPIHEK